uniref:Succinate dehydrogenase subunit 3 n=1 Tax=Zygnema circumcarinatum TaxID=35869 RepID=A0A6N0GXH8_ZYGCR|nr:succinate dehydrogenase subunit 3 [Zygnema circumcarinatum]QKQ14690.1 succinate dehydrogenase subunit 3 [Zygnema circumcarinatum]WEL36335.1 succinate dehydrogenase subunit 3 [Zygnema circumcarinatum]
MKINRPLSPHLTIYKPQLTSTLSILHRISGAFLASILLFTLFCLKLSDLSLSFYAFYWCVFNVLAYLNWFLLGLINLALLALCYHMSNGIRHLIWDLGFCLDLSKVYTSGILMLVCAVLLALFNWLRFFVF